MTNIKEILDNAPEDATHFTSNGGKVRYFKWSKLDQYLTLNWRKEWTDMYRPTHFIRSIDDVREIFNLTKENNKSIVG